MKIKVTTTLLSMLLICFTSQAQQFKETIKKELSFSNSAKGKFLIVENIYGSIEVEEYNGSAILLEVDKQINANSSTSLEKGKNEIGVLVSEVNGNIHIYPDTPYTFFNEKTGNYRHEENNSRRRYEYRLDYRIKVPRNISIELNAINDGDITVDNVQAEELIVRNINGAIFMNNVSGQTRANAINKDINISYTSNPKKESSYSSINGDINIILNEDLDADISFKTLNGDFYTNVTSVSSNPSSSIKPTKGSRGTKYEWDSNGGFRLGNGGVKMNFDVLNGDVTIKR